MLEGLLSHLCHRAPARSFLWLWNPPVLCARCTGFYTGIAIALLLLVSGVRVLKVLRLRTVVLAATPTAAEVVVSRLLNIDLGNPVRALAALSLGVVLGSGVLQPFSVPIEASKRLLKPKQNPKKE